MNLLTTKLALPPLRQSTVSRPRLYARLDAGLATEPRRIDQGSESEYRFTRRLTLLSAPAGFGKSTLVRAWIERFRAHGKHTAGDLQADLAWFMLDAGVRPAYNPPSRRAPDPPQDGTYCLSLQHTGSAAIRQNNRLTTEQ